MYRLGIADDEKFIRQSLAQFIPWEELGFRLVLLAADGMEVIDMLQKEGLDAVLCDIHMQESSGLDVAQYIFEQKYDCKIVLLSGYEDFEYARKAIRYNVHEYLLKPINPGAIREVFGKVKEELDHRRQERQKQSVIIKQMGILQHMAIERMIEQGRMGLLTDRNSCLAYLKKCNLEEMLLDMPLYQIQLSLQQMKEYHGLELDIVTNIMNMIFGQGRMEELFLFPEKAAEEYSVLILRKERFRGEEMKQYRTDIIQAIQDICKTKVQVWGPEEPMSLEQYLSNQKAVLLIPDVNTDPVMMDTYLETIARQYLTILNMCSAEKEIEKNLKLPGNVSWMKGSGRQKSELLEQIFQRMDWLIKEQLPGAEIVEAGWKPEWENVEEYFVGRMKTYYGYLRGRGGESASLMGRVKDMVKSRISENITLTMAAEQVFLSPNYFSRLFKETTGENYSEYCIRVKMEYAAELLRDPRKKVYEISDQMGYGNIKYFYKLFKRVHGCTPTEYRGDLLKK